ncbi:MAG TPA: protein translocase subunit SecD [Candidatus Eisenbacteria bacterium]|nr:protein translocase subunit SecD [Candidatus Eisenbacteria bacterium]
MTRTDQWKLLGVVVVTVLAVWFLYPSFRFYSLTPAQRTALAPADLAKLRKQAIHLGLDLQGGLQLLLEVDRSRLNAAEAKDAPERAMEIIRNRVDQFGVAEPLIQREGEDRIAVQLPGLTDRARAIELIGKTALLEFKLVRTQDEARALFSKLDSWLAARRGAAAGADTALARQPLTGLMIDQGFFRKEDEGAVDRLLATPGVDSLIPADTQLLWGNEDMAMQGMTGRMLYVLKKDPEMTGGSVASAEAQVGLDQTNPGAWGVSMKMTPRGRADFARVTGANVGRQLAIVLDGVVQSAPFIRDRIPSGDASITGGSFDVNTARDLAIVLRAGALPAPVRIIEERTVGPSLGSDSIQEGITAGVIGTVMVVAFMAIYYQLSGLIAIAALLLNVVYLIAALAYFGATLTLPGIAGIVLTIGMAVDTNVLIFERIREELRHGRSVHESVRLGYDRAFRTIFDAHSTTLISALFLFQFGTGPIKGFAVTLSIGLIANLFTAVVFTRMIYDFWLSRGRIERLSV